MKLDYNTRNVPTDYVCGKCGVKGVKLWRMYNTFLEHQKLTCIICSGEEEEIDVSDVDEGGRVNSEFGGRTDQIGSLIPAVPTEECDTYWGYTSVPQDGVEWWKRLNLSVKDIRKEKLKNIGNAR